MKKVITLIIATVFVGAACGGDDDDAPEVPVMADEEGLSSVEGPEWVTQTDPLTGVVFRCLYGFEDFGYSGGPYVWCYRPAEGEMP